MSIASGSLFQLTHYLDIVETQIGRQISGRSETFFKAMSSHDQLQTYLAQTKYAVQRLRYLQQGSCAFVIHVEARSVEGWGVNALLGGAIFASKLSSVKFAYSALTLCSQHPMGRAVDGGEAQQGDQTLYPLCPCQFFDFTSIQSTGLPFFTTSVQYMRSLIGGSLTAQLFCNNISFGSFAFPLESGILNLRRFVTDWFAAIFVGRNRIGTLDSTLVQRSFRLLALHRGRLNRAQLLQKVSRPFQLLIPFFFCLTVFPCNYHCIVTEFSLFSLLSVDDKIVWNAMIEWGRRTSPHSVDTSG